MRQLKQGPSKWGVALKSIGALLPVGALALGVAFSFNAGAVGGPTTVVVTPTNTQGWSEGDTNTGGTVDFVTDTDSPLPTGALQLTTDSATSSRAQYMHSANVPLADITELSYSTKQVSGPAEADASYQLPVMLNGTTGFTTLVYEPYWNKTVEPGVWENQDVDAGKFWSSNGFTCSNGTVQQMRGGPATYTLQDIQEMCPEAVVIGFGVNVGTSNLNYDVEVDGVDFNGTTYDFQTVEAAKEACKNGGYQTLMNNDGQTYNNQGQCVADVVSSSNSKMHR